MYYKNLDIFIQCHFSKFFFVDEFNLADSWKNFFGGIGSPSNLFLGKFDVNINKGKEKHAKNHFYANFGQ